jgi:hypothetical protein
MRLQDSRGADIDTADANEMHYQEFLESIVAITCYKSGRLW